MSKVVKIVLAGIGGYGGNYVDTLLDNTDRGDYEFVGAVDPYPQACNRIEEIHRLGVPVYSSLEEFYKVAQADLAVISSPIQFHCQQTCTALANGSHVLCEKPVAASIQEVEQMIEARDRAGKFVAVGYQWSFSKAVLNLKRDILNGRFGRPVRLKTLVLWPRNEDYYSRGWAGRKTGKSGELILDSVAANATAHYLHNMFFVLGEELGKSVQLESLTAETYRANQIENYDTCAVRAYTRQGTELLFLASHAIHPEAVRGPEFEYVFENGIIRYLVKDSSNPGIIAEFSDGKVIDYGSPYDDFAEKLWISIAAVQSGASVVCGLETAFTHTRCINGIQQSVPEPAKFPEELIQKEETARVTYAKGLAEALGNCYSQWKMPHELNHAWAFSGEEVKL